VVNVREAEESFLKVSEEWKTTLLVLDNNNSSRRAINEKTKMKKMSVFGQTTRRSSLSLSLSLNCHKT